MFLKEKKFAVVAVGALILVALGVYGGLFLSRSNVWQTGESGYTVVYLVSGDMYFGKLSGFPRPHLTDVWYMERGVSPENQPQLGVTSFKSAVWGPKDVLYLNPKNILWQTELSEESPLIQAIAQKRAAQ
ncbi:MAG: hypothetical protein AAB495_00085 [Patescibacteria group bacterium]